MSAQEAKGGQPEGLAPFSNGLAAHRVDANSYTESEPNRQEHSPRRVRVYIDGFNLYHAIAALKDNRLKWLNLHQLSSTLLRNGEVLDEVNLFTAVLKWSSDKKTRHENFLVACRTVGVNVHEATFKRALKHCVSFDRDCRFYEEKQTDVAIAVKLVSDAMSGHFGRAILITADSDQIPTAKFISGLPGVELSLVFPPGRKDVARDLGNTISDKRELKAGRLLTCMLPRTVRDGSGKSVATMPALYLEPISN